MVINVINQRYTEKHTGAHWSHVITAGLPGLVKDDIHVYTLDITSDESLIRLCLMRYCTCFTDNKMLLLHQTEHFVCHKVMGREDGGIALCIVCVH